MQLARPDDVLPQTDPRRRCASNKRGSADGERRVSLGERGFSFHKQQLRPSGLEPGRFVDDLSQDGDDLPKGSDDRVGISGTYFGG